MLWSKSMLVLISLPLVGCTSHYRRCWEHRYVKVKGQYCSPELDEGFLPVGLLDLPLCPDANKHPHIIHIIDLGTIRNGKVPVPGCHTLNLCIISPYSPCHHHPMFDSHQIPALVVSTDPIAGWWCRLAWREENVRGCHPDSVSVKLNSSILRRDIHISVTEDAPVCDKRLLWPFCWLVCDKRLMSPVW